MGTSILVLPILYSEITKGIFASKTEKKKWLCIMKYFNEKKCKMMTRIMRWQKLENVDLKEKLEYLGFFQQIKRQNA